jgi:hypothetical protein
MGTFHTVSGYWKINKSKRETNYYDKHIKDGGVLKKCISEFRTIYCNDEAYDIVNENLCENQRIIRKNITDFYVNKFEIDKCKTHSAHAPSHDIGRIWLEKIQCLYDAFLDDVENNREFEWYVWLDVVHPFFTRNVILTKWPNLKKINLLNREKINFGCSYSTNTKEVLNFSKYAHNFAGGCFIIHKSKLLFFRDLFYNYLEKYIIETNYNFFPLSDQCVFTRIMADKPDLFHAIHSTSGKQDYCIITREMA